MDFFVGQIFDEMYPIEAAQWCNKNNCYIEKTDDGYEIKAVPEYVYTLEDYDNAVEAHLTNTRVARGYTVREPSAYINSSNARWAQDAQDWVAFIDEVMEHGQEILNSGVVPEFDEFKADLPIIEWTYQENTEVAE